MMHEIHYVKRGNDTQAVYPWLMPVGDSFAVPAAYRNSVYAAAAHQKRKHGRVYTVRWVNGRYVCSRLADRLTN